jgi:hypothetical protein
MAITKIEYQNKVSGDLWTSNNANEVKSVVNGNADELAAVKSGVNTLGTQLEGLGNTVQNMQAAIHTPKVVQEQTEVTILPNKLNIWGRVPSLIISFASGKANVRNEYMLRFTVGAASFTLQLPSGVRWVNEPDWEQDSTYEVSIEDGLAVCAGWEAATS